MEFIRVTNDVLYTPVLTFAGRRRVELVGMIHFGKKAYYRRIQRHLRRRSAEGFQVFYENYTLLNEEPSDPSDVALVFERELNEIGASLIQRLMEKLRLSDQSTNLKVYEHWVDADIPIDAMRDVLRQAIKDNPRFPELMREAIAYAKNSEIVNECICVLRKGQVGFEEVLKHPDLRSYMRAIIQVRNEYALSLLRNDTAPAVLPWGAMHLQGLSESLEAEDLQCVSVEWIRAFHIPKL